MPSELDNSLKDFAIAAAGGALLGVGIRDRRLSGLARLAGVTLVVLAARRALDTRIRRAGTRRRTVSLHTGVDVRCSISDAFAFFKDFENFPRVVGSLRSVTDYEDGRSHWEAFTPAGDVIAWDAVVTKYVPHSVIAWQSVRGSPVNTSGLIRFSAPGADTTHLDITLTYRPERTGLADALHALIAPSAADQVRTAMEQARFYLETHSTPLASIGSEQEEAHGDRDSRSEPRRARAHAGQ